MGNIEGSKGNRKRKRKKWLYLKNREGVSENEIKNSKEDPPHRADTETSLGHGHHWTCNPEQGNCQSV